MTPDPGPQTADDSAEPRRGTDRAVAGEPCGLPLPGIDAHVPPEPSLPNQVGTPGPSIAFTAYGDPKPGGSKKAFKHPHTGQIIVTDMSGKPGKTWRSIVQDAAGEAMAGRELFSGPLAVEFTFHLRRPKSHYRTGASTSHLLTGRAPLLPTTKPDVLKLARAVEDALSAVVYEDDALITDEVLLKRYARRGEPPRVEVSVVEIRP